MTGFPLRRVILVWLAATVLVHAALAVWVRSDARRTGRDPGRWPVRILAGGLFGLVGYLRARR